MARRDELQALFETTTLVVAGRDLTALHLATEIPLTMFLVMFRLPAKEKITNKFLI